MQVALVPVQVAQLRVGKEIGAFFGDYLNGLTTVGATQRNCQSLNGIAAGLFRGERQGKRVRRTDYGQPLPGIYRLSLWLGGCFGFGGCFLLREGHDILRIYGT